MAEQEFWTHENWSGTLGERIPDVLWHRATRFLIVILYAIPLMKRFLLFLACVLFCFGMFASGARAQAVPCCSITAIDAQTGIVSAKVNSTSAVFQFKVTDAETLQSLRVGQGVYANFTTNQVSLDGKKTCCSITNRPQAPVAAPITRPVSPSANGPATSQPSRPQAPVAAPLPRPVLPPSTRGPAASQPSPTLRNQANAVQILKKVASPVNVRTTQSLDECRTYANGNSIGCATAMQGSYYIVIWDWNGADGDIDGFNVYQGGATTPSSSRGPVTQLVQQPIQTISQHPLLRVAVFDPKQLGTNACFTITAYSGGTESARSPQACVTAANASSPVLSPVAPPLPAGTYLNSCQAMSLRAGILYASCKNNGGQYVPTSLPNIRGCVGDVFNEDGVLHCTDAPLPPGSYTKYCQATYINGGTLYARCNTGSPGSPNEAVASIFGTTVTSPKSLPDVSQCGWGVDYSAYALVCVNPPGSYQQTCQNIQPKANGATLTLSASCENRLGQWVQTSLNVSFLCMPQLSFGGDIFNLDGRLECTPRTAVMDYLTVPSATTPDQANSLFSMRANIAVNYAACHYGGIPAFSFMPQNELYKWELPFTIVAIAKLEMGGSCRNLPRRIADNIAQVGNMLTNSHLHDDWQLGTNFPPCRTGELDTAARGLITILYRYPVLPRSVYNHVLHDILAPKVSGAPPPEQWYAISVCGVNIPETENHILMTQTSRYLTNQLLGINNETNGFNAWMLQHLQSLLKNDFVEYNAKPYQTYSMMALQNLYDFAGDRRVKLAAQMVLDFESTKFAVSSSDLRRAVPFRRREEYLGDLYGELGHGSCNLDNGPCSGLMNGNSDPQTYRFMMLSGMTHPPELGPLPYVGGKNGQDDILAAAVTSYRIPNLILDIILNKQRYTYYQRIRGSESTTAQPRPAGVELYSGAPPFLITAGGYWQVSAHSDQIGDELNCDADTGWPLPATLMPGAEQVEYEGVNNALDYTNFIRIDGDRTIDDFGLKPETVAGGEALGHALGTAFFGPLGGIVGSVGGYIGGLVVGNKIECHVPERHRRNTCVAPGFACGLHPIIPASYLQVSCRTDVMAPHYTQWTFIDASENSQCPRKTNPGFCAVVYTGFGGIGGFFEAAPSQQGRCIAFRQSVMQNFSRINQSPNFPTEYVTAMGHRIRFDVDPGGDNGNKYVWGIQSIDGKAYDTNIGNWPLAVGDIINSCEHSPCAPGEGRDGYVTIDNPVTGQRLILDMRDPMNPQRTEFIFRRIQSPNPIRAVQ